MLSPAAAKARRKRHQPSTIDRLEPEMRELIAHLRIDKGWSIDQIKERLAKVEQVEVSRSALGRHVRDLADVAAQMRDTQIYAEALAKEVGDADEGKMLSLNAQMLQANMFRLMLAEQDGEGVQLAPKDAKAISEVLRNLALTRRTEIDVIERAEKRAAEKALSHAAEQATRAARSKGLSKETVDAIRHAVLGSE